MTIEEALHDIFGLDELRPGQRAVIDAVLAGRPTVTVMPTGAGKSLCYQLPAVVAGGTALVVSPLIALMKDQVDALAARGVPACAITSAQTAADQTARLADIAAGRMRLVYVAPERFKSGRFDDVLSALGPRLTLLAIDEAHCISEWGHDFRPDYMRLGEMVQKWRPPRLVALTATATPEVRRDIVKQLGMTDPLVLVRGFDRPNLRYSVEKVTGAAAKIDKLRELILGRPSGGAALVYAATRKNAEEYTDELRRSNVRARAYHAGLADDVRSKVQDDFMSAKLDVVVATNAFGMGVDKSDVRLVIHADLPRSPEAYYQEAGRGGRDGDPAECVLLFQHSDVKLQEFLIDASSPSVELLRGIWRAIRSDPRAGSETRILKSALPERASDAAISTATRFLSRAGYLRERDGIFEAYRAGDDPGPAPAPLDTAALAARAEVERNKLRAMVDYAYSSSCRRRTILVYFGDEDGRKIVSCESCDNCEGGGRRALDAREREAVRVTLALIERLRGRFGRTKLASVLAANDDDDRFTDCPERGALRAEGERWAMDVIRAVEGAGLVEISRGEYPTVSITASGKRVAAGEVVELALPEASSRKKGKKKSAATTKSAPTVTVESPLDEGALGRLRTMRTKLADAEDLPAYCILHNKTLEAIARALPADLAALGQVSGVGPSKLEKYGEMILEALTRQT